MKFNIIDYWSYSYAFHKSKEITGFLRPAFYRVAHDILHFHTAFHDYQQIWFPTYNFWW